MITSEQMIEDLKIMDNGERLDFLEYMFIEYFDTGFLSDMEGEVLEDLDDGYVKIIET